MCVHTKGTTVNFYMNRIEINRRALGHRSMYIRMLSFSIGNILPNLEGFIQWQICKISLTYLKNFTNNSTPKSKTNCILEKRKKLRKNFKENLKICPYYFSHKFL